MFYNRKYQLEKYIKNENYENFDRMKVIHLFYKIINEIIGLNLKRKRIFKFTLILCKVFEILQYKIEIPNNLRDNKASLIKFINCCFNNLRFYNFQSF